MTTLTMSEATARLGVRNLLVHIGEDPDREGLLDTPARVTKAWREMTVGYGQNPANILERDFDAAKYDEMILVPNIEFISNCEHHMLPFWGFATLAYLPSPKNPRVVGLSKLARLVDCFARRLQIQEQMTAQIADAIMEHLKAAGCGVVIESRHSCMSCRGVMKQHATMLTSALRGNFKKDKAVRAEFLSFAASTRKTQ